MSVASLTHTTPVRIYDVSASGCLLESQEPLPVGTVGLLTMDLDGRTRHEWIRVCRVHADDRRPGQISVEFLPLGPAGVESLRGAVLRLRAVGGRLQFPTPSGRSSGDPGKSVASDDAPAVPSSPGAPALHTDLTSSSPADELATPLLEEAPRARPKPEKE